MTRTVARKIFRNGRWGEQSAALQYGDGRWIVAAWDRWVHDTLAAAKTHYRSIG
jgi:hypothetical protein